MGVSYREHANRRHNTKLDRYYRVRFKSAGTQITECYGWSSEGWTLTKVADQLAELKHELKTGKGTGKLADKRKDKRKELREIEQAPTVTDLWNAYQAKLSLKKKKKAPTTTQNESLYWKNKIKPELGDTKLVDVTPAIIAEFLEEYAKSAPVSANRIYSLLSVMFKVALPKGWLTIHPMQWLDRPGGSEPPRKRILSDEELSILWPHFNKMRHTPRDILKLGLLTAQRTGEIMSMRWPEVDLDTGIWRQETNKTDTVHLVPLSSQVVEILRARDKAGEWVFPSTYNKAKGAVSGHAKTTKNARQKAQKESEITNWTAHDLRRTARTIMSRLNIKHHIRERVLNHSQGGVVGVYDQHDYLREKSDALEKLGQEIYRIVGLAEQQPTKIIKLVSNV